MLISMSTKLKSNKQSLPESNSKIQKEIEIWQQNAQIHRKRMRRSTLLLGRRSIKMPKWRAVIKYFSTRDKCWSPEREINR
jgi:cell division septum initiation protein DivIVA